MTVSIGKLAGGTAESHGETRWQRLHLQLRSGQLHNGKRVGTHGNLHHLRNGGDFGFLDGIPENRREGVDRTPTHNTHLYNLFISAERTPRAWLKSSRIAFHLCAPEKNLSPGVAHVSPFVVLSPAVYHEHIIFFIHSSLYHDTRTRSTTGTP